MTGSRQGLRVLAALYAMAATICVVVPPVRPFDLMCAVIFVADAALLYARSSRA